MFWPRDHHISSKTSQLARQGLDRGREEVLAASHRHQFKEASTRTTNLRSSFILAVVEESDIELITVLLLASENIESCARTWERFAVRPMLLDGLVALLDTALVAREKKTTFSIIGNCRIEVSAVGNTISNDTTVVELCLARVRLLDVRS